MTRETQAELPLAWHDAAWARISSQLLRDELPHALLMTGPAGLGKRRFARRLAMAYLCSSRAEDGAPCAHCRDCALFRAGSHPDWLPLAPEEGKAEIAVDATRGLIARLMLTGGSGRRVALIDPADAMNRYSANALLKTLEEPPGGVLLLLVSELPHRLPVTIRSRCQRIAFSVPDPDTALEWLRRQGKARDAVWHEALMLAGGAPLRALQLTQTDALDRRAKLLEDLAALSKGSVDPEATAAAWCKQPLPELLDSFARWLAQAAGRVENESPLQALLSGVNSGAVLALYDEVNRARATLDTQLRSDLMIEALLIQWWQLTAEPEPIAP